MKIKIPYDTHKILLEYFHNKHMYQFIENNVEQFQIFTDGDVLVVSDQHYQHFHRCYTTSDLVQYIIITKDINENHYEYIINNYPEILY